MLKKNWETEELIENWTLIPRELELVSQKVGGNQIGFAVLWKYFQLMARFPDSPSEIPENIISYIANQLNVSVESYSDYNWQGRSSKNYRVEIRNLFNFKVATVEDSEKMSKWLITEIIPNEERIESITEFVYQRFRDLQIEPPTPKQVERLIRHALTVSETQLCNHIFSSLKSTHKKQIDILLNTEDELQSEKKLSQRI